MARQVGKYLLQKHFRVGAGSRKSTEACSRVDFGRQSFGNGEEILQWENPQNPFRTVFVQHRVIRLIWCQNFPIE
jgi:hypothetical protein